MFESYDARLRIDAILLSLRGESLLVYFSAPEIPGDRKQMRIPENRVKIRTQIRLYPRGSGLTPKLALGSADDGFGLLKRFALTAEVFGKNDRFGEFAHRTA